jgi:predicted dehydrogenase
MKIRHVRQGQVTERTFPSVDHFSGMIAYFSDCILKGERPEPDGEEGLADVRALRAIETAAASGTLQRIDSPPRPSHPVSQMMRNFPPASRRLML